MSRERLAVFASGGGSNMVAIADYLAGLGASAAAELVVVLSDRRDAGALLRAHERGIETVVLNKPSDSGELLGALDSHAITLIALAGYLRLVPREIVARFEGRILNVHPALLPEFGGAGMYGLRVHEAVLRAGATRTGVTIHLVNDVYDSGSILAQWPVPVLAGDTAESLARRVLAAEHILFPRVLQAFANGGIDARHPVVRSANPSEENFSGNNLIHEIEQMIATGSGR